METMTSKATLYGDWYESWDGTGYKMSLYALLETGQIIAGLHFEDTGSRLTFGWLSGSLYVSRDHGLTWAPSTLCFSVA